MGDLNRKGDIEVNIVDKVTQYSATVDASGRLTVNTIAPSPAGTVRKTASAQGDVNSTAGTDTTYVVTSGKTLTINRLSAGAESTAKSGSVVELFYDALGTGVTLILIDAIYLDGGSNKFDEDYDIVGDGTKMVRLRRRTFTADPREMYAKWEGYETT